MRNWCLEIMKNSFENLLLSYLFIFSTGQLKGILRVLVQSSNFKICLQSPHDCRVIFNWFDNVFYALEFCNTLDCCHYYCCNYPTTQTTNNVTFRSNNYLPTENENCYKPHYYYRTKQSRLFSILITNTYSQTQHDNLTSHYSTSCLNRYNCFVPIKMRSWKLSFKQWICLKRE